ncbi:MAG: hypothetical protein K0S65_6715, partial [Labilithrix sp.]|nr:hypothetical protein [Labilithrix sp.]
VEARAGLLAGSTTGFRTPYDTTSFLGIVGAGVLGRVLLGPSLRVEMLPDLRMSLVRDDFRVRDRGELVHVHRPAAIEARLSLGLAWELH